MSINWESYEKRAKKMSAKIPKAPKKSASKQKEQKAKEKKLAGLKKDKTVTNRNGKKVNAGGRKKLTPEVKDELEKAQATYKIPKFMRNMTESAIDNSIIGTGITIATGHKPSESFDSPYYNEIHSGTTAKLGRLAGQMTDYGAQFAMGGPALDKATKAVMNTKLGKAAASKFGDVASGVAKSVIGDATIGLGQNVGMAAGEGKKGKELAKDVAINTGLDLALGGLVEVTPAVRKALKSTKLAKQAENLNALKQGDELLDTAKKIDVNANERLGEGNVGKSSTKNVTDDYMDYVMSEAEKLPPRKSVNSVRSTKLPQKQIAKKKFNNTIGGFSDWKNKDEVKGVIDELNLKAKNGTIKDADKWNASYALAENAMSKVDISDEVKSLQKELRNTPISINSTVKDGLADGYSRIHKDNFGKLRLAKDGQDIDTVYWNLYEEYPGLLKGAETQEDQLDELIKLANEKPRYIEAYKEDGDVDGLIKGFYDEINNNLEKQAIDYTNKLKPVKLKAGDKINGFDVEMPKSKVGIVNPDVQFVGEKIENAKGLFDKFYKNAVSGQKELERMSKVAGNTKVDDYTQAVRTAKGTISNIFNESLVDTAGKVINKKSYKSLISEIPKDVRKDFQTYAEHLHNIDRVREGVPVYKQFTAEQSQQIVDDMLKKHPEFKQYTKDINEWWNQFTKAWLLDTGRISKESYEAMLKKYPNYIPTYRVDKGYGGIGSLPNRINVGSGVKGAKGGESEIIPLEDSFLAQIDRIVSGTRKNDLYASVIEEISKNPEKMKPFGVLTENKEILKNDSLDDFLGEIDSRGLQEVKNGAGMVTAYIDGKPVSAYVNKDMMDALKLLNDAYDTKAGSRLIGELGNKITNPVKAGITGYNPLFAISNMMRDFPTLYIQSQHSMWKTTTGLGKAIKNMLSNSDLYKQYKALGGKASGYYATGKGFEEALGTKGIKSIKGKIEEVLSIIGEGGETIPRFAEFINSMEKYGDSKDAALRALKDAGEVTVNFSRSAPLTKTLDGWTLYLNAAVQGLDKFGRTIKNAPLKTLGRSAAMISIPYAALMVANWDNPHYQDLNERTKQNYFCIPNYSGEKDVNGNPMTFIKVPLNREYGAILGSSLDVMYGLMNGQSWEEATKGFKETLENNFAPPNPITDNILSPITINLPNNADFAGRAIVPESLVDVSPINQQDYTTSGIAKGVAKATNNLSDYGLPVPETLKSPKKIDYLIDQYGGYYGQVAQAATGGNVDNAAALGQNVAVEPFKQRFTADPRFSSGPVSDFYDAKEKALIEKNDAKLEGKETSEGQIKSKVYNKISKQMSELTKEEKDIQSSNLPKKEKDRKVKELRTKKNELAKGADAEVKKAIAEYKTSPTFANLPTKTKEKYNSNTGLSKEKWAKAYESQKDEDRHFAKAVLMVENGVTSYNQAKTIYSGLSQNSYNEGVALYNAGVKIDDVKRAYANANTDGGGLSKAETMAYLNGTNYSREQKRAIFDALMGNAKNPY